MQKEVDNYVYYVKYQNNKEKFKENKVKLKDIY